MNQQDYKDQIKKVRATVELGKAIHKLRKAFKSEREFISAALDAIITVP